jgi:hypothetical protein
MTKKLSGVLIVFLAASLMLTGCFIEGKFNREGKEERRKENCISIGANSLMLLLRLCGLNTSDRTVETLQTGRFEKWMSDDPFHNTSSSGRQRNSVEPSA